MIIVAEMQNGGVFEAPSKKKLTDQIIQHFAQNNQHAEQIKAIYLVFNNNYTDEICGDAVRKIQNIIDNGVASWRQASNQEYDRQRDFEQAYWENIL